MITAVKRNTGIDYVVRIVSLAGLSAPAFYIGLLLMYLLLAKAGWFPAISTARFDDIGKNLHALVLPAITLGLVETAYVTPYDPLGHAGITTSPNPLEMRRGQQTPDASRLATRRRADRGAGWHLHHRPDRRLGADREVFARPGLGKLMVGATTRRDYTLLQAIMVVYALIIVVVNILVDIIYTWIDPRVQR